MKNILIVVFFILSIPVYGQQYLEVILGPDMTNISSFGNDEEFRYSYKAGIYTGLLYGLKLSKNIDIESGVTFNRKGAKVDLTIYDVHGVEMGNADMRKNYDYLSMPVNVRLHYGEKLRVFLGLGVVPAYLLKSERYTPNLFPSGPSSDQWQVTTNERKRFDLSARAETGVLFQLRENLGISARIGFQHSILPFHEENYHRGTTFLTGIQFIL